MRCSFFISLPFGQLHMVSYFIMVYIQSSTQAFFQFDSNISAWKQPSEQNTYADIEAAYNCLKEKYGVREEDVILYGQSVGSGPTLDLASRLPYLRAVVLHSAILSGLRVLYQVKRTYWFDIYKVIFRLFRPWVCECWSHGSVIQQTQLPPPPTHAPQISAFHNPIPWSSILQIGCWDWGAVCFIHGDAIGSLL